MKKKQINIFLVVALIVSAAACNKNEKLNPLPTTLISDLSAFETPDRISNQVNGLYATYKQGGFWGSGYLYYSEARAGDFIATNLNPTRGALSYQMIVDPATADVANVWEQGYQVINGCNVFIEGMEKQGNAVVGDETGKNYVAEARFLRALAYYYLLQLYADPYTKNAGASPALPLRLTANRGLADYNLARSSVAQVYNQVISDLNFAEQNLPDQYSTALLNTTRAHKNTAIAAKTNVYLSMGKYDSVVYEANKIVSASAPFAAPSGVANALAADITAVFKAPYTSAESVFSMPFSATDVPGTSLGNAYLPDGTNATGLGTSGTGDFYLFENGVVNEPSWSADDKRRSFVFRTPSGPNTGRLWCVKYRLSSPYIDFIPVIRYAEVLLNLAEALANLNGVDNKALALLNAVRNRSDNATTITAGNKQELIDKIITERHIEFFGEGIRNADLMRLQKPVPAKTPSGGSPVAAVAPGTSNYIWPIPNSEALYNRGL
ncbi:hypothetical protein A8C56_15815 [Niabella ginsenosidivorans]|uniref:Carbohydrate-binding protein SusD n=1 Tax=Niabella ginsenosidivorans TaxID=1176587 RepID=A0A1A9I6S0_9BACT|nr:RagB/SusD family nutrient uptake outer membrane protein [Niabella ginsenosidivorans]ANH82234.1 hypothetical protein A8C56_15815 [Niabella ginsenosidivorans]